MSIGSPFFRLGCWSVSEITGYVGRNVFMSRSGCGLFRSQANQLALINSSPILRKPLSTSSNVVQRGLLVANSASPWRRNSGSNILSTSQCRMLRTTPQLNAVPPVVLLVLSKAGKYVAVFIGRHFRNWWHKLPAETKAEYVGRAKRNRQVFYGLLGLLGIGGFVYYNSHIQEAPITKRKRFLAFTDNQIDEISKHELDMLIDTHKKNILPHTDPRHLKVYSVAQRLVGANKDLLIKHGKNKNWTVTVVQDETINAFVLSCGNIFVFTGLLSMCEDYNGDSESALAIILGHELSHVLLNHSAEQASFLHMIDMLFIIPMAALWALLPSDAIAAFSQWVIGNATDLLFALPFGRALETEADEVGLLLAAAACFDIRECLIWKKMELMNNTAGNAAVELFSTHPSEGNRFENLQNKLPSALEVRDKCQCPKLPFLDLSKRILEIEKKVQVVTSRQEILAPLKMN